MRILQISDHLHCDFECLLMRAKALRDAVANESEDGYAETQWVVMGLRLTDEWKDFVKAVERFDRGGDE